MPRCRGDRKWLPRAARRVEELVGDVGEELLMSTLVLNWESSGRSSAVRSSESS